MAPRPTSPATVRFGIFEADLRSGELRRNGLKVRLGNQPARLLALLLEHPGELLTRDEIRQTLWPHGTYVDFDKGVSNAVNRLREALGDSGDNPRFIETVPRRGFRFIAPVVAPLAEAASAEATQPSGRTLRLAWIAVAVLLTSAVLLVGLSKWQREVSARAQSVAVLPFLNLSGDPEQEYFSDGLTDAVITELAKTPSLKVVSRGSVMHYKNSGRTIPEIARELNAHAVVEGSVVRSGSRIRVHVQLIDGDNDRHTWAKDYERNEREVIDLERDLALAIGDQVGSVLAGSPSSRPARQVNPDAYEAYLKGVFHGNKRSDAELRAAVEYFETATRVDPKFAPAYAGLADAYNLLGFAIAGDLDAQQAAGKAKQAALRALELDPDLGEAHAALGFTAFRGDWDWDAAETHFRKAIALSPGSGTAHLWYGLFLTTMQRTPEAIEVLRRARELDPMSPNVRRAFGYVLARNGQYDEASREFQSALEINPNQFNVWASIASSYEMRGDYAEAVRCLEKAVKLAGDAPSLRAQLAHVYAVVGRRREAEAIAAELLAGNGAGRRDQSVPLAKIYAGLKRKDDTLALLSRGYEAHAPGLSEIGSDLAFADLRGDPRFEELLRKMRLK